MKLNRVAWLPVVGVLLLGTFTVALAGDKEKDKHKKVEYNRVFVFNGQTQLGVQVKNVTPDQAKELKLPGVYGAVVQEVEDDTPAAKAGLQANDVLLSFDGERVRSVEQLRRLVRETPTERPVKIEYSRNGKTRSADVTLEQREARMEMPDMEGRDYSFQVPIPHVEIPRVEIPDMFWVESGPRLGISGDELTPQLADYFGVKQGKGVLVREVMVGSAAARAGLQAGDVIVNVDGEATPGVGALRHALRKSEKEITVTFVRNRQEQSVKVTLDKPEPRSGRRVTRYRVAPAPPAAPVAPTAPTAPTAPLPSVAPVAPAPSLDVVAPALPENEMMQLQEELMDLYRELGNQLPRELPSSRALRGGLDVI